MIMKWYQWHFSTLICSTDRQLWNQSHLSSSHSWLPCPIVGLPFRASMMTIPSQTGTILWPWLHWLSLVEILSWTYSWTMEAMNGVTIWHQYYSVTMIEWKSQYGSGMNLWPRQNWFTNCNLRVTVWTTVALWPWKPWMGVPVLDRPNNLGVTDMWLIWFNHK